MKKVLTIVLVAMLSLAIVACGSSDSGSSSGDKKEETETEEAEEEAEAEAEEAAEEEVEEVAWEVGEAQAVVWANSIDTQWVQMIVPVTNTGSKNLYLDSAKIDLEDETGHLIDSKDYISGYPQVIQPGETAYYYEETTLEGVEAENITAIPHVDLSEAKVECIRLDVSDLDIVDDGYGDLKVTGRVENNTGEDQDSVYIVAFFYDGEGKLIGSALDLSFDTLTAGDKVGFSATSYSLPSDVTLDAIANYEVVAFPYQFQF